MPDPYRARGPKRYPRTRQGRPVLVLDVFLSRLAAIGATPDELDAVEEAWDPTSPEQVRVYQLNDVALAEELRAVRVEHQFHTTETDQPTGDPDDEDPPGVVMGLTNLGAEVPDVGRTALLEWVGDDLDRARAALDHELAKGEDARTSVVDRLERVLRRPETE